MLSFDFEFRFWVLILSFYLGFLLPSLISRNPKLKIETRIWNWNSNLKSQIKIETWNWKLNFELETRTRNWNSKWKQFDPEVLALRSVNVLTFNYLQIWKMDMCDKAYYLTYINGSQPLARQNYWNWPIMLPSVWPFVTWIRHSKPNRTTNLFLAVAISRDLDWCSRRLCHVRIYNGIFSGLLNDTDFYLIDWWRKKLTRKFSIQ